MKKHVFQKGNVMLVTVLFFITVSTATIIGLTGPTIKDFNSVQKSQIANKSYAGAESGVEDAIYRVKNNKQYSPTENLILGGTTITTDISNSGGIWNIDSVSSLKEILKNVSIDIDPAIGFSMPYAIEAGPGGVSYYTNNWSYISGNVISNGWLENGYTNDLTIFGNLKAVNQSSAVSGGTFPATTQPPTGGIWLQGCCAYAGYSPDLAQSFTPTQDGSFGQMEIYFINAANTLDFTIQTNNPVTNRPSGTILVQGQSSHVNCSGNWCVPHFTFYGRRTPTLYAGETYWFVLKTGGNYWDFYNQLGTYSNSNNTTTEQTFIGSQAANSWTGVAGARVMYRLTLGGVNGVIGTINHSSGGVEGNVYANTVYNTPIYNRYSSGHAAYCNTAYTWYGGSTCSSSFSQGVHSFTVTNSMINSWKSSAESGSVVSGNTTIAASTTTSYGPTKIVGDLQINGTLNLTGALWVTGNITMGTNGRIQLDSNFGDKDGVIITDGRFKATSTSSVITGTTAYGSYTLIISLSKCPSSCDTLDERAISWSGSTGSYLGLPFTWISGVYTDQRTLPRKSGPMFFAPNGWVKLDNYGYANYVAGDRVEIVGGAGVSGMESTMSSMNFMAGKSIKAWKEGQ